MPLQESYNPSGYTIEKAKLKSFGGVEFDIQNNIVSVDFAQDMGNISYTGKVTVLDNNGILENMPIRGEETLTIEIITMDLKTKINLNLFVYSVSNIRLSGDGKGTMYDLDVVSKLSFKAGTKRVVEPFNLKSEEIVKKIFEDKFSKVNAGLPTFKDSDGKNVDLPFETKRHPIVDDRGKNLYIQPGSSGKLECIIPNYLPGKAMDFIAKRSFNSATPSQSFKFFETWDGYYFVTDEFLTMLGKDKPYDLFYTPATGSLDPRNPADQLNRVEAISVMNRGSNTGSSLYNGAYVSQVKEVDLLRRQVTDKNYFYIKDASYIDMSGNKVRVSNAPHSKEFIEDTFKLENAKRMIIFRDYASPNDNEGQLRGEQYFDQIASNRLAYAAHQNAVLLNVALKGRADLTPGKVINLTIQNADSSDEVKNNAQLSGRYLIRSSRHVFNQGVLETGLVLSKYDWSK